MFSSLWSWRLHGLDLRSSLPRRGSDCCQFWFSDYKLGCPDTISMMLTLPCASVSVGISASADVLLRPFPCPALPLVDAASHRLTQLSSEDPHPNGLILIRTNPARSR